MKTARILGVVVLVSASAGARATSYDYETRRTGDFVVTARAAQQGAARFVAREGESFLPSLERDLGGRPARPIEIRIAANAEDLSALAPPDRHPPPYAVGFAVPDRGLVLVSLVEPRSGRPTDLRMVFRHELVHLVAAAAARGRPMPRWFAEGVAIEFSGERQGDRTETLWSATVRRRLLPLAALERRFPADEHQVGLAYAESADFARYLWREGGRTRFQDLLGAVGDGVPFDDALESAFGASTFRLERDWRADLGRRYRVLPALTATSVVYALLTILLAVAVLRHRTKTKKKLRRLELEDALEDVRGRRGGEGDEGGHERWLN